VFQHLHETEMQLAHLVDKIVANEEAMKRAIAEVAVQFHILGEEDVAAEAERWQRLRS